MQYEIKSMKIKYLFLFFIFYSISSFSQERVFGIVLDDATKEPIPGVSIYYENTSIGTTSDIEGEFAIRYNRKTSASLVFSFIGYTITKVDAKNFLNKKPH